MVSAKRCQVRFFYLPIVRRGNLAANHDRKSDHDNNGRKVNVVKGADVIIGPAATAISSSPSTIGIVAASIVGMLVCIVAPIAVVMSNENHNENKHNLQQDEQRFIGLGPKS